MVIIRASLCAGSSVAVASGRLSYALGLHGLCQTVTTACSAALVAMHNVATTIHTRESEAALAAGVSVLLLPLSAFALGLAGMTSKDGRSKTLDMRANGFGRGEGIAAVFLESCLDDPPPTSWKSSAVQQDGKSASLVAPNGSSQRNLLQRVMRLASVSRGGMHCIEMHGTGTKLGDPIECVAVTEAVLSAESVTTMAGGKANIGHLEPAAGAFGLFKLFIALGRSVAAGNAHLKVLNPHIGDGGGGASWAFRPRTCEWAAREVFHHSATLVQLLTQ